jgi:hypothetical protein
LGARKIEIGTGCIDKVSCKVVVKQLVGEVAGEFSEDVVEDAVEIQTGLSGLTMLVKIGDVVNFDGRRFVEVGAVDFVV